MEARKADGYVVMAINKEGKETILEGPNWFDFNFEDVCFSDAEGGGQLVDGLPKELRNVQLLVAFEYKCVGGIGFEGEWDGEEFFNVASHTLITDDYKEFSRKIITEKVSLLLNGENIDDFYEQLKAIKEQKDEKVAESESLIKALLDEDFEVFGHLVMKRSDLISELIHEIDEWEEFHDEDFKLTPKKPKSITFPF